MRPVINCEGINTSLKFIRENEGSISEPQGTNFQKGDTQIQLFTCIFSFNGIIAIFQL